MSPKIDWRSERQISKGISDFVDNLAFKIKKELPKGQRAQEFRAILNDIDPLVLKRVDSELTILTDRGVPPDQALRSATKMTLVSRRKEIFRYIFDDLIPKKSKQFIEDLKKFTQDPNYRARLFEESIIQLRPIGQPPLNPKHAFERMKETGLSDQVAYYVATRRPLTVNDIRQVVKDDIDRGSKPIDAMYAGHLLAMREFVYDKLGSYGVAAGPDFCIFGAVIGAAAAVVTLVVSIAVSEADKKEVEDQNRKAEKDRKNEPLSRMDLENLAQTAAMKYNWFEEAEQDMLDFVRTQRFGRTNWVGDERAYAFEVFQDALRNRDRIAREKLKIQEELELRVQDQRQAVERGTLESELKKRRLFNLGAAVGAGVLLIGGFGLLAIKD